VISPSPEDEAALDATKAPLMEHLIELRKRLIYSVLSFAVAFAIAFSSAKYIYAFLTIPLANALAGTPDAHLIFTALGEVFFAYVKIGMFGGLCLAFPFIAGQIWMFIAPGLYKHERNAFLPFLLATPFCFIVGAGFAYYVLLPYAIHFFIGFQTPGVVNGALGIQLQAKVSEYLDLVMKLLFAFGFAFQLPVLLSLLGKVGIITSAQLRSARRFAIVGMTAVAAVITPPDPVSMLALAVPMWGLYEISVWLVVWIERNRARDAAAREATEAAAASTESAGTDVTKQ
jgi:sec-independent protein translocase protein TatC